VILSLALLVLILVLVLLPPRVWRSLIVHSVSSATGRSASIDGGVTLHLLRLNPELTVEGFRLADAPWAGSTPMLTVRRFDVTLRLLSLLRGQLVFPKVIIDGPNLELARDDAARANWDFSSGPPKKANPGAPLHIPVIQQLSITDGRLRLRDNVRKLYFDGNLSVNEASSGRPDDDLSLHGAGMLNGKPFDLRIHGGSLLDVDASRRYRMDMSVSAADIALQTQFLVPHPFDLATIQAQFALSGGNLADFYYLSGLALPNSPRYDIAGTLRRDNQLFKIDDLHGKIGNSDIAGKIQVDAGSKRPKLTAQLTSRELNLADLAAPLGAGASAGPQASESLRPTAPSSATPPQAVQFAQAPQSAAPPRSGTPLGVQPSASAAPHGLLLPDADLQVDRVRGMDADVSFDAAAVTTAKLPVNKLHFHLTLNDGMLRLMPLAFSLPIGQFLGSVSIDARGAVPQTEIDMRLADVDLAQFKSGSATTPPLEGHLLGRVRLHGSGTSVHKAASSAAGDVTLVIPKGQMREAFAELTGIDIAKGLGLFLAKSDATTDVRCAVASFHASDGDLKATAFVVDTTHVLITGGGHVDLKSEDIDLSLRGEPKEVRLLRLRAPIDLRGTLLHPRIGLDARKALVQAGGAAALGALLTPVAAVLAFVDRGLAKDANCAALLGPPERREDLAPAANLQN